MHHHYDDIIKAVGVAPTWWQEEGVPRFCEFTPDVSSNIYADEVALVEIACQSCDTRFNVAFNTSAASRVQQALIGNSNIENVDFDALRLSSLIASGDLFYGDPPNTGCCAAGPTMTSETIRVIEYWHRHHQKYVVDGIISDIVKYSEWRRNPEFEITFEEPFQ